MNENDSMPYIALLSINGSATGERLEYAFHTFSLRNECYYTPTGDVTFSSPNPDASALEGGVERLVDAVLQLETTAVVLSVGDVRRLLADSPNDETLDLGKGMMRQRNDLEALCVQALATHDHRH